jgi:hypothetical protein
MKTTRENVEDFLIEIFGHCNDKLMNDFIKLIEGISHPKN